MDFEVGLAIFTVFMMIVLYLGLIALGMFITYLIIKWAINRSKVNANLEALRLEVQRLNMYLQAQQGSGAPGSLPPQDAGAPPSVDSSGQQED